MSEARGASPKRFEFNAELSELRASLRRLDDPLGDDRLFRAALPLCARTLRARRVGLWRFTEDRTALVAALRYDRVSESWSAGETVTLADHPQLWAVLGPARPRRDLGGRSSQVPPADEVGQTDPGVLDGLRSIAAAPIAPIGGDEMASGALWCEPDDGRDRWTEHELIFVEQAARIVGEALASADEAAADREAWRRRAEQLTALLAAIDVAFDGVPVPGEPHPTLHKAEASDWPTASTYDPSQDHRGRWQDLPLQHLRECPWALARLDAEGLHYYLPAIMTAEVRWHLASPEGGGSEEHAGLIADRLRFMLTPDREEDLRDLRRTKLRLLTGPQRAVIGDYLRLTALGLTSDERSIGAWDREDK